VRMHFVSQTFVITEFSLRYSNLPMEKRSHFQNTSCIESQCLAGKRAKTVARWPTFQLRWDLNMPDFVELVTPCLDLSYP
jgi:hypothetical protein